MKEALERIMEELRISADVSQNESEEEAEESNQTNQEKWDYYIETD